MNFIEGKQLLFQKLGEAKIMALASCENNYPMVRNVSCVFYDEKVYFKTDINFVKTKQLLANPQVALCFGGVQIEGIAKNKGLVIEEEGRKFETLYKKHWWKSYNAYSHEESEILIEITPMQVEIWDQDEHDKGFQTFLDFQKEEVSVVYYDK